MTVTLDSQPCAGWTARLWTQIAPIYDAIVEHPFTKELLSGQLPVDSFVYFISQDILYLQYYARALLTLAGKAPEFDNVQTLITDAVDASSSAESELHAELMINLGRDPAELATIDVRPTTHAYASFLMATVSFGSFADGLAAVLPCFWVYGKIAPYLKQAGSDHPVYQRWIDSYARDDFQADVTKALELADQVGHDLGATAEAGARRHFHTAARYEWMFLDAAYRLKAWPI